MDYWDSYCPQLRASEHAVKGTDLSRVAGKEDPVEFDFKQEMCSDMGGVVQVGDASRVNSEIPLLTPLYSI